MDPYQSPDEQEKTVIDAMIQRLQDRGENKDFNAFIDHYLAKVPLSTARKVLDLGCGTGVVTRRIAATAPNSTELTGVDVSEKLIEVARQSSSEDIHWAISDGETLPFDQGEFDLIVMHTLLSHVPDPVKILQEAKRLLSPGGTIIVFDADYASTTYAIDSFEKGREIDLKLLGAVVHNLNVCRVMPRHIKNAGLQLKDHDAHIISEAGQGDFWLSSVQGFAKLIPALGILPENEGQTWIKQMIDSHENGTFFASGTYYTYFITHPISTS